MAIYKRGQGFELGATEKQIQVVVRAGLEPGTAGLRVRQADHSATLPPCLLNACELSRFEPGTFSLTLSQLSYLGNHVQILKNTLSTILIVKENTEIHKQFTFTVNLWYKILYDFFESYCTVERE